MLPLKEIIAEISSAFKKRNQKKLRKINDRILKTAVLEFNRVLYDIAVMSYVLAKIISKPRFLRKELEDRMIAIEKTLDNVVKNANNYDEKGWLEAFATTESKIKELEADDARFITDLMTKGKLKVAATLYAQGLSLGLAAEMTGMNKQDILDYAGKTMMFDRIKEEQNMLDRMKNARKLLGS